MDAQGRTALVTGCCSGLGAATSKALLEVGVRVVGIDLPGADATIFTQLGGEFSPADVRDPDGVQKAVDLANTNHNLAIVVNAAGVATPGKLVGRKGPLPVDQFNQVISINLTGTFNVSRLAAEAMIENGTSNSSEEVGVIINTASVAAFDGQVGQIAYSASKGGVVAMTLPMARELAPARIRVMTIAPGIMDTPMMASLPQPARDSLAKQIPHPARLGKPEEYAQLVQSIIANPILNGEVIRLDGAIRMAAQ